MARTSTRSWLTCFGFLLGLGIAVVHPSRVHAQPFDPAIVAQITSARATADTAFAAGDYRGAEIAFVRALTLVKTLVPDTHQDIAIATNNVAVTLLAQGDFARAKPLLIDVSMRIDRLGLFNAPIGFITRDNLIQTLMELGQSRQAQELAIANLAGRLRIMSGDAVAIGTSVNTLMLLYIQQGAYAQAEQAYQQAAILVPSQVPETEIVRAALLSNLALALLGQEKISRAEQLAKEAIKLRQRYLPFGHPDTAISLSNLSSILLAQGRHNEALALQRDVFASMVASLGANHPKTIGALTNIGISEERLGQTDKAIATAREVVTRRRAQQPISTPDLAKALNNLATPLVKGGNTNEAITLLEEARALVRNTLPASHPDALAFTNNLAVAMRRSGRVERAIPLYREAIAGWENRPEKWHSLKAISQTSLVMSLVDTGARTQAYNLQRQVGSDLLENYGARAGIDIESQREFRKWQWVFRGQMQLGWFASHPDLPLASSVLGYNIQ